MQQKKKWEAPNVMTYGNVSVLTTQTAKWKKLGLSDDFGVPGISDGN